MLCHFRSEFIKLCDLLFMQCITSVITYVLTSIVLQLQHAKGLYFE